jgi:tRNA threonylcarbamoyladenosine biosynthesis protein TsaB
VIALGIETSGPVGSVALCNEEQALAAFTFPEGARHARDIMPAVERIFREAGLEAQDVGAVAVSEGPGSFTGLRIGVACAKTLAYALGWRAVGVPSLEVLAQNVAPEAGVCCPTRDARRERVYGTVFEWRAEGWWGTTGVLLLGPEELARKAPAGAVVLGSGVRAYPEAFASGRFEVADRCADVGRAEAVACLGLRLVAEGRHTEPMELLPRYYRLTEAEEKTGAAGTQPGDA